MRGPLETVQDRLFSVARAPADKEAVVSSSAQLAEHHRLQLLQVARNLERCGRHAERFLALQLDQLQQAISDFEQEKAAWQRQRQRETADLKARRCELDELQRQLRDARFTPRDETPRHVLLPEVIASGSSPLRLLLAVGKCSSLQIGLLTFEIAKFNRDLGGDGVRFEVVDCREPRRLLFRRGKRRGTDTMAALDIFSTCPVYALHDTAVADQDENDDLNVWLLFKSRLLESSLVNPDVEQVYRRSRSVMGRHAVREMLQEAAARGDASSSYSAGIFARSPRNLPGSVDFVSQQLQRLERCTAALAKERGLKVHVSLV